MIKKVTTKSALAPTPMAVLALGIASLGWSWENVAPLDGMGQITGAVIAGVLLIVLTIKFMAHGHLLKQDMAHPVVGSILPTFAMAVLIHVSFLVSFIYHRSSDFQLSHMVPSWFVPPVGLIVADVSFSGTPELACYSRWNSEFWSGDLYHSAANHDLSLSILRKCARCC
jgi:tellurite resistance protein TehA-like permease